MWVWFRLSPAFLLLTNLPNSYLAKLSPLPSGNFNQVMIRKKLAPTLTLLPPQFFNLPLVKHYPPTWHNCCPLLCTSEGSDGRSVLPRPDFVPAYLILLTHVLKYFFFQFTKSSAIYFFLSSPGPYRLKLLLAQSKCRKTRYFHPSFGNPMGCFHNGCLHQTLRNPWLSPSQLFKAMFWSKSYLENDVESRHTKEK